jgi:glycosyltransferase involved in cell wall biosynthesis
MASARSRIGPSDTVGGRPLRVLFLSHDAARTGAPILLRNFARWVVEHTNTRCAFASRRAGPLMEDFASLGPTAVLSPRLSGRSIFGVASALMGVGPLLRRIGGLDIIYSNTLTNGKVLADLAVLRAPVISHAHELDQWIQWRIPRQDLESTVRRTQDFVACSSAVAKCLTETIGLDPTKVHLVHEFIPARRLVADDRTDGLALRRELAIPESALIVGGSGTPDLRKGIDLFIRVAQKLRSAAPDLDARFVWVGGGPDYELNIFRSDVSSLGLSDHVYLVGERRDAPKCFAAFDILLLTSREDPYPLVMLEAAALGKPCICFLESGGAPEFVENDAGTCVPYLDVDAMASQVVDLFHDHARRRQFGDRAQQKVIERHDIDVAAPKLYDLLTATALGRGDSR